MPLEDGPQRKAEVVNQDPKTFGALSVDNYPSHSLQPGRSHGGASTREITPRGTTITKT